MKTRIVKVTDKNAVPLAVAVLEKGGLIIYPTETQYGIGADVASRKAVKKIFTIKQRPEEKKVIWAFSDAGMVKEYFSLPKDAEKLVSALMPGPFTLVINDQGFRIPGNKIAQGIIKRFGRPVTTTSANISGRKTPRKIKEIIRLFDGKVDMVIDADDLKKSRPSTIFRWDDKKILRKGPVTKRTVMKILEKRKAL